MVLKKFTSKSVKLSILLLAFLDFNMILRGTNPYLKYL